MGDAELAVVVASAIAVIGIALRLLNQKRLGTLDWRRERPLLVAAPLIVLGLALVAAGGRVTMSVIPPLVMCAGGVWLVAKHGSAATVAAQQNLRILGYLAILAGAMALVTGAVRLLVGW